MTNKKFLKIFSVIAVTMIALSVGNTYALGLMSSLKHATQVISSIFVTDDWANPANDKSNVNVEFNELWIFINNGKSLWIWTYNPANPLEVMWTITTTNLEATNDILVGNNATVTNKTTSKDVQVNDFMQTNKLHVTADATTDGLTNTKDLQADWISTLKNTTVNGNLTTNWINTTNWDTITSLTTTTKDLNVTNNANVANKLTTKGLVVNETAKTKDLEVTNQATINKLQATNWTITTLGSTNWTITTLWTTNINNGELITTKDMQVNDNFIVWWDFTVNGDSNFDWPTHINGELSIDGNDGNTYRNIWWKLVPSALLQNLWSGIDKWIIIKGVPFNIKHPNWSQNFVVDLDGNVTIVWALNIWEWKLKDSMIISADIKDGEVKTADILNNTITDDDIINNWLTALSLAANSVQNSEIQNNAVTTNKIKNGEVKTVDIASSAVTTAKIANLNVTTAKIANSAVNSAKVENNSLTADDLAANSVGNSELINAETFTMAGLTVNGTVTAENMVVETITPNSLSSLNVNGDILPESTSYRNIWSSTKKWASMWLSNNVTVWWIVKIWAWKLKDRTVVWADFDSNTLTTADLAVNSAGNSELVDDISVYSLTVNETSIAWGSCSVAWKIIYNGCFLWCDGTKRVWMWWCDNTVTIACTWLPTNTLWKYDTDYTKGQKYDTNTQTWIVVGTDYPAQRHLVDTSNDPCEYECMTNYTWDGNSCEPAIQQVNCPAKKANSVWNDSATFTQTWNWSSWLPTSKSSSYNTSTSSNDCRYKCDTNYTWNTSTNTCVTDTRAYNCAAKPWWVRTLYNTVSSYTQTRNGSARSPANDAVTNYSTTASSTSCRYKCSTHTTRNWSICVADIAVCLTKWTKIQLWDGTMKNVENITRKDTLMWPNGEAQTIEKLYHIPMEQWYICGVNGDDSFFTTTHPFMTLEWRKSVNPEWTMQESPWLMVTTMQIWDYLVKDNWFERITSIDCEMTGNIMVYDFWINDTKSFYANGYLTHNVDVGIIIREFISDPVYAYMCNPATSSVCCSNNSDCVCWQMCNSEDRCVIDPTSTEDCSGEPGGWWLELCPWWMDDECFTSDQCSNGETCDACWTCVSDSKQLLK